MNKNISGVLAIAGVVGGVVLLSKSVKASVNIVGDVNGDGVVDVTDYIIASEIAAEQASPYYTGTSSFPIDQVNRADLNGDGVVDDSDLTVIENIILGL